MESLAFVVSLILFVVLLSGPAALLFTLRGYVYIGGTLGFCAVLLGGWFVSVAAFPGSLVGWLAVLLGAWCFLQAWRATPRR